MMLHFFCVSSFSLSHSFSLKTIHHSNNQFGNLAKVNKTTSFYSMKKQHQNIIDPALAKNYQFTHNYNFFETFNK